MGKGSVVAVTRNPRKWLRIRANELDGHARDLESRARELRKAARDYRAWARVSSQREVEDFVTDTQRCPF